METNEMTPERSLQIISDAIAKSRRDFEQNGGKPMILWGIVVFVFSVLTWGLVKLTGDAGWYMLWFGVPVVGVPLTSLVLGKDRPKPAKNFTTKIFVHVWTIYGIFATALAIAFSILAPEYIAFATVILMGFATAVMGLILSSKWIIAGGLVTGIACPILLHLVSSEELNLLFALIALADLIVPGIMMNRKRA